MDEDKGERGGQEGREGAISQYGEGKSIGDIALVVGMNSQGQPLEMILQDSEVVQFCGRWMFRGTQNGNIISRFVDTTMGFAQLSKVGVYRDLPRQ